MTHEDDDLMPERRRIDDQGFQSIELVLYQIGELKAAVREGFQKMEGRFDKVDSRLTALERFRERVEERDRADADSSQTVNSRWVPVMIATVTVVVTVILFLAQNGA